MHGLIAIFLPYFKGKYALHSLETSFNPD